MYKFETMELAFLVLVVFTAGLIVAGLCWLAVVMTYDRFKRGNYTVILHLANKEDRLMSFHKVRTCKNEYEALVKAVADRLGRGLDHAKDYLEREPHLAYVMYGHFKAWKY